MIYIDIMRTTRIYFNDLFTQNNLGNIQKDNPYSREDINKINISN